MDRRLKERLIGATILVGLIVLIVPELLSGPKRPPSAQKSTAPLDSGLPDTVRNVTVDLSTQKATPGAEDAASGGPASTAVTPPGAAAPTPDAAEPASDAAAPAPADMEPDAGPANAPLGRTAARGSVENDTAGPKHAGSAGKPAAAPPAAAWDNEMADVPRHAWAVQVGSFANKSNAEKLVRHLRLQYPSVGVAASGSGPALRYRVRVGALPDRNAALQALGKLKAQKYQVSLVAPSP